MIENTLSLLGHDVVLFLGKAHRLFDGVALKDTQVFQDKVLLHADITEKSLRDKIKSSVALFKKAKSLGYKKVLFVFDKQLDQNETVQILKKLEVFNTPFDTYLEKKTDVIKISVYDMDQSILDEAKMRSEAVNFARYLVNEPGNVMTPTKLSTEALNWANNHNIEVEVYDESKIKALKMDAFLSVAKGSVETPKFMVLRYLNNPESSERIGLVGKGVTYDSGGLAIKSTAGMVTMHSDMGGSAAVIGAIGLLAAQNAKVNAIAVVAACENMISGSSFKNGDIIGSMSGKTIEVMNTDAEGRLTLADAIYYAHSNEGATRIIDIATLTGAAIAALGNQITAVVSDDEAMFKALETASIKTQDKVWRMPVDDELAQANHATRADLKNATTVGAGTTTAALFLKAFADDIPWTHLDIAGTAYGKGSDFDPQGATGVGVELLSDTVKGFFK